MLPVPRALREDRGAEVTGKSGEEQPVDAWEDGS